MPQVTQEQRNAAEQRLATSPAGQLDPAAPLLVGNGFCPVCGDEVTELRDELSLREFGISGLCQSCQDQVFGYDGEAIEVPTDPSLFEAEEGE